MNFEDDIFYISQNESKIENDGLKNYKAKTKYYICEHQYNEAIKKLKSNIRFHIAIQRCQRRFFGQASESRKNMSKNTDLSYLGKFVCEIVGLDMNTAKATFSEYLESNNLDNWQI